MPFPYEQESRTGASIMTYMLTVKSEIVDQTDTLDEAMDIARATFEPDQGEDLAVWEDAELICVFKADGREVWVHAVWTIAA